MLSLRRVCESWGNMGWFDTVKFPLGFYGDNQATPELHSLKQKPRLRNLGIPVPFRAGRMSTVELSTRWMIRTMNHGMTTQTSTPIRLRSWI